MKDKDLRKRVDELELAVDKSVELLEHKVDRVVERLIRDEDMLRRHDLVLKAIVKR